MAYECKFCFIRSFEKLLKERSFPEEKKDEILTAFLKYIAEVDSSQISPLIGREMEIMVKKYLNNPDPYKEEKRQSNQFLLNLYPKFKKKVETASNPFETALRLAIAGNIIDYAASTNFNVMDNINYVLNAKFGIDHSRELETAIKQANTILYLGDNTGEIVLDKLFIETIGHPNVYFAVKEKPVINDATMEDARYTGMDKVAKIISNGYDAPSTILDKSSKEFIEIYQHADLVISKGQGNLEGLFRSGKENTFFLLMVKCDVIARLVGVKKDDFVVFKKSLCK
ncbi:MAG: ARMT1-like domain-containing protein [Bacteroidota bacterium]|nr:ARMT1-like domain-containing protein [Bacteroidota bacterium]